MFEQSENIRIIRRLPKWMIMLQSEEAFVNVVPSLKQIASASIIKQQSLSKLTTEEKHLWNKAANCKVVYNKKVCFANDIKSDKYNNCKPFVDWDIKHKSVVKHINE